MSDTPVKLRIWDVPVRIFHWLLIPLMAFAWWTEETDHLDWHRLTGYVLLALVLFRIVWGFIGSDTARFSHFLRGPRAIAAYLGKKDGDEPAVGHNPIGGWSVLAMLALISAIIAAGLFAVDVDGIESGPLSGLVSFDTGRLASHIHELLFYALLALIGLHVLAILYYAVFQRDNLVGPMITGSKSLKSASPHAPAMAPIWRAVVALIVTAFGAYAVSQGFWIH